MTIFCTILFYPLNRILERFSQWTCFKSKIPIFFFRKKEERRKTKQNKTKQNKKNKKKKQKNKTKTKNKTKKQKKKTKNKTKKNKTKKQKNKKNLRAAELSIYQKQEAISAFTGSHPASHFPLIFLA